ncbi:MAG: anthranilate phosphoribosyltransferase, partial [bacterium]|nr:anthranilate phosphoribosyltransferase [bacterium]
IDVCGTGGSGLPRINTSTISAFILSKLGVGVAKHGNKAASGRFGSFDLLEEMGVDIEKSPEELERCYGDNSLAFIYARSFHPVMRHFVEARKAIGKPTIFNILGPLLNPAGVDMQIIGTGFKAQMRLIAETCKLMGKKRVLVVRGSDGLDEVTLTGETDIAELNNGIITEYTISPEDFGIEKAQFEEIAGGSPEVNTEIALKILNGSCKSRHADLVNINTALALKLIGKVEHLKEGYQMAKGVIAYDKLAEYMQPKRKHKSILAEIADSKRLVNSDRDFFAAISKPGLSLIAEIKMASPSEGDILTDLNSIEKIAYTYETSGASAISVVTDEKYFKGSYDNLRKVREITKNIPLLCKDFILNEFQIFKAREYGADAILLISSLLPLEKMEKFFLVAKSFGMDVLFENHNEEDLKKSLEAGAKIIGINNRDLRDFSVDLETTNRLIKLCPKDSLIISESGIKSGVDLEKLDERVDGILVGTALMRSSDINSKIHEFTKKISLK